MTADPLLLLSATDLREIASALEGGRLTSFSALSVAQWASPSERAALASGLEALEMDALVLARTLRLLASQREAVRLFVNVPRKRKDAKASDEDLVWAFAKAFRKKHWPGQRLPEVYYDPRSLDADAKAVLHAKVIVVDDEEAFVSSANFTESAQERNIEAGVHFRQASAAMALRRQFDTLVAKKRLRLLPFVPQ